MDPITLPALRPKQAILISPSAGATVLFQTSSAALSTMCEYGMSLDRKRRFNPISRNSLRVIAQDLPGFGNSTQKPERRRSIQAASGTKASPNPAHSERPRLQLLQPQDRSLLKIL